MITDNRSLSSAHTLPAITFVTKKGSQQMMKTPITVPSVLAAFVSLENLASFLETPLVAAFFLLFLAELSDSVERPLCI